ncbi:YceD family protein [Nesterenkonia sp.]|uniref:YceD family protein n=1 Tax=Nesterenkonia sp. TaxID=704201 RepID=UPI00262BC69E|nr:YceD family protein [Nesterenkonia sp.]
MHPQQKTLLQVDVKELKGKPGAQETLSRTVPTPADFATVLVGIPEASDLNVQVRLESVHEGVLLTGSASAEVTGECARCLDAISYPLTVDVMQLFTWVDETGGENDDGDSLAVDENLMVDVEPVLRDLMVSALPFQPVCREDCPGLCSQCGFRLEDDPEHAHEQVDPRWAALAGLAAELNENEEPGGEPDPS